MPSAKCVFWGLICVASLQFLVHDDNNTDKTELSHNSFFSHTSITVCVTLYTSSNTINNTHFIRNSSVIIKTRWYLAGDNAQEQHIHHFLLGLLVLAFLPSYAITLHKRRADIVWFHALWGYLRQDAVSCLSYCTAFQGVISLWVTDVAGNT